MRVFVNSSGIDIPPGSTAIDAVRAFDAGSAQEVSGGSRIITDSRGLPIDAATPMSAGSILRLVANRDRSSSPDAES
ncbi:MAG TPA: hypothetical protein VH277_00250 [Gemmatimonadaceae bacterium]|jgi:hypothetical protein|nr:hypothetical protein [Gemmatimonadaceae bacterium]